MSMQRVALFAAFAATEVAAACAYGTPLMPRAEAGAVPINTFGYSGNIGPANWHLLDPEVNAICATGTNQSPIDMTPGSFKEVPGSDLPVKIPDFAAGATFENLGTTVEIIGEGGSMSIKGKNTSFDFKQFHFHLPSEHLENGTSMAMEMHMVFASQDAQIAVMGVYLDINTGASATAADAASEMLETVFSSVGQIAKPGTATKTPAFAMSGIVGMLSKTTFKSYSGSLTTPPCSEGVNWFVSNQKLSIKLETYKAARAVIGLNARFAQNAPGKKNILALSAADVEPAAQ